MNLKPTVIFDVLQYFFYLLFLKEKRNAVIVLTYSKSRWLNWWIYPLLNRLTRLKYIVIIHGGGLRKWDWPVVHSSLIRNAAVVIGVSERICKEYKSRVNREVIFIPPVIPFNSFDGSKSDAREMLKIKETEKVVLMVGSLKPLKNPQTIIDAANILGKDFLMNHEIKFIFAGDGILKSELESSVKQIKLENYFLFLGNVSRNDIPRLYKASDFYIIGSDFEGTPISLLEAMFNSLIVIGSNSPGINSIIINNYNGCLFETKNASELSSKIKTCISSSEFEKKELTKNAKIFVDNNYNFEKMINEYNNIINKV